jgi:alanine dehydrogenase
MLLLANADVERILTMAACIEAREAIVHEIARGDAVGSGRSDVYTPSVHPDAPFHRLAAMMGASRARGYACARVMSDMVSWPVVDGSRREDKWAGRPGRWCGLLFLYATATGEPLAIIHDGVAQHMRVGAGAGVGARILARPDSETLGILGSGGMAWSYLEALAEVLPLRLLRVFSPNHEHREAFAARAAEHHGLEAVAVDEPRAAVRGADVVALCVSAVEPVFFPEWLEPGMHVTDVTRPSTPRGFHRAVDAAAWNGNQTPIVDPLPERAMYARGGILAYVAGSPEETAVIPRVPPDPDQLAIPTLPDVVAGRAPGRTRPEQTTFFHNVGASAEGFAAIAGAIYEAAVAAGVGREFPTEWFLEDVRD